MFSRNPLSLQAAREVAGAGRIFAASGGFPAGVFAARVQAIELVDNAGAATAPEWIDVLPVGRFTLDDGRGEFTNNDPAAVIAASLERGIDLVIDFDHATVYAPKGTKIPAAGWIKQLEVRDGKVRARVEWTESGALAVAKKEWRYISPVFIAGQDRKVTRLWHASLTNDPAIAMRAIAAAQHAGDVSMNDALKLLASILGLADTATEAEILAAAKKAKPGAAADSAIAAATLAVTAPIARALGLADTAKPDELVTAATNATAAAKSPDPAKFSPIAVVTDLQTRLATLETAAKAEAALAEVDAAVAAGKLIPAQRDWGLNYATRDLAGFKSFLAKQPTILASGRVVTEMPKPGEVTLTAEEKTFCASMGLAPEKFLATKKAEAAAQAA